MIDLQTKDINININGKDGLVKAYKIQRHKPIAPMCFIQTETGHMLFCQENHPVIVYTEGYDNIIEAKDVIAGYDEIYVDNSDIDFPCYRSIPTPGNINHIKELIKRNIMIKPEDGLINDSNIFLGDNNLNFYLNIKSLKLSTQEYIELIMFFISNDYLHIKSFNLVSQIKMMADRFKINVMFEFDPKYLKWSIKSFSSTGLHYENEDTKVKDYVKVKSVLSGIEGYEGYVYDLKTESEEFMNNCVQTHNSFHTGGAVEFHKINIINELSTNVGDEESKHLERSLIQKDNDLYSNTDLVSIKVDKSIFQDKYKIKVENNRYHLALGYFNMDIGYIHIPATIEQKVELIIPESYNDDGKHVVLMYGKGDHILHAEPSTIAPEKVAAYLDELVAGKSPWTTPESLFLKFYNNLEHFSMWDTTHLEVIIGTILRNKRDPQKPARLVEPYEPETHSIKSLPSQISWAMGLAYENIARSISSGMISEDTKNPSAIEEVLFGEPLSDLSKEKLKEKYRKK